MLCFVFAYLGAFGHVRPTWIKIAHPTPPFLYPWAQTIATLKVLKDSEGDPHTEQGRSPGST